MARLPDAAHASSIPSSSSWPSLSSPLLRLTPRIRDHIYRYLGMASWDGRPYQFHLHAGQLKLRLKRGYYELRFVPDPDSFHGLLVSCRAIYSEAATLLYSANQFILHYSNTPADPGRPTSFRPLHTLHALTAPSLRSLRNVKMILNEAACHQLTLKDYATICCAQCSERSEWGLSECKKNHGGLHQLPLLSPASMGDDDDKLVVARAVLSEWHSAAARLLSHVPPGQLVLSLVCDIDPQHPQAVDVATSALEPILVFPPAHLQECHIRLAKTLDSRLQQLAQDTVSYACGMPTPYMKPPSRATTTTLATLPRELRIRVLEYTDLVTPRREVTWSRQNHAYTIYHYRCEAHDPPDNLHSNQFFYCWFDKSFSGGPLTNGCFCRRRHAAFSPECKCWAPPGPTLFLICRALYEDAQFVFFSNNRFIIHDYKPWPPWTLPLPEQRKEEGSIPIYRYPNERLAASEFLRDVIPTRSLTYIRFLELVFPPYHPGGWPQTQHPAMQDWRSTVDWLQNKVNPPGLTIRFVVTNPVNDALDSVTAEEGEMVMTAYMDLLQPLTELVDCGLAGFYAHLAFPWERTEEFRIGCRDGLYSLWEEQEALKERAERYVLGQRYENLYANRRKEPKLSDWYVFYYSNM